MTVRSDADDEFHAHTMDLAHSIKAIPGLGDLNFDGLRDACLSGSYDHIHSVFVIVAQDARRHSVFRPTLEEVRSNPAQAVVDIARSIVGRKSPSLDVAICYVLQYLPVADAGIRMPQPKRGDFFTFYKLRRELDLASVAMERVNTEEEFTGAYITLKRCHRRCVDVTQEDALGFIPSTYHQQQIVKANKELTFNTFITGALLDAYGEDGRNERTDEEFDAIYVLVKALVDRVGSDDIVFFDPTDITLH